MASSSSSSSSITLQTLQGRSYFLGRNKFSRNNPQKPLFLIPKEPRFFKLRTCAKFDLSEILGGRGLCNGEKGLEKELERDIGEKAAAKEEAPSSTEVAELKSGFPEEGFDKELMGLTGGFPGGEKGLEKFIQENPPPKQELLAGSEDVVALASSKKPKPPPLPLLMPGMIALVKNPNSPYYMYCGIVQRITDGKAGLLLEGGVWDRLITFRLEELERREKGPPGKNPRSVILETLYEQKSE